MQEPTRFSPRETTAVMASNIGRELRDIRAALADSRGDRVAEHRTPLRPWPTCWSAAVSSLCWVPPWSPALGTGCQGAFGIAFTNN
jgi:hypothetical protein